METIDKVDTLAANFILQEEDDIYFRYNEETSFSDALYNLLSKEIGDTDLFSVVDKYTSDNTGIISVAFFDNKTGLLEQRIYTWEEF